MLSELLISKLTKFSCVWGIVQVDNGLAGIREFSSKEGDIVRLTQATGQWELQIHHSDNQFPLGEKKTWKFVLKKNENHIESTQSGEN